MLIYILCVNKRSKPILLKGNFYSITKYNYCQYIFIKIGGIIFYGY